MRGLLIAGVGFAVITAFATWWLCRPKRRKQLQRPNAQTAAQPNAERRNNRSTEAKGHSTKPEGPHPVTDENWTETERKQCQDCVMLCVQVVGLVALIVYSYFTYGLWREAQRQTANSDRPWVGIDTSGIGNAITIDDIDLTPKRTVTAHFTVKNFGNRPALKVNPLAAVSRDFEGVIMMWGASECGFPAFITTGVKDLPSQGQVLFPNEAMPGKIKQDTKLPAGTTKFWIAGCISYLNQFKRVHWTRFCYEVGDGKQPVTKDSTMDACQLYNDTDETEDQATDLEMLFPQAPKGAPKPNAPPPSTFW